MNGDRPFGVSLLAIHNYAEALWALVISVGVIAMPARFYLPSDSPHWTRLLASLFVLLIAGLIYLWARGLWELKNWARRLQVGLALIALIPVRGYSGVSAGLRLVPAGPIREILGLVLIATILLYLFSPGVRRAFGVNSTSWHWQAVVGILCLGSAGFVLYKSKPELKALQWHRHHGDSITVNGITFPVYKWDAPSQNCVGFDFEISPFQRRGPLLDRDPTYYLAVEGFKDESDLSAEQRTDKKILEYQKAGYRQVGKSQLVIAEQTLSCMREEQFDYVLDCYGDGPIYQVHFAGDDAGLERFNQMMAAAH